MPKPALRVIFDTNVFSPDAFDVLEKSPIRNLCASGRLVAIYGHIFLEETLRAYGVANRREDLVKRWLPFIADTVDRFCEDFVVIWHRELVEGRGAAANIYMSKRKQDNVLAAFRQMAPDGTWRGLEETRFEREAESQIRSAQRETSKAMRLEAAERRRAQTTRVNQRSTVSARRAFDAEVDRAGRAFIEAQVPCDDHRAVASDGHERSTPIHTSRPS